MRSWWRCWKSRSVVRFNWIERQVQRARHLLAEYKAAFLKVIDALEERGLLESRELQQMLQAQGLPIQLPTDDADHLRAFSQMGV